MVKKQTKLHKKLRGLQDEMMRDMGIKKCPKCGIVSHGKKCGHCGA